MHHFVFLGLYIGQKVRMGYYSRSVAFTKPYLNECTKKEWSLISQRIFFFIFPPLRNNQEFLFLIFSSWSVLSKARNKQAHILQLTGVILGEASLMEGGTFPLNVSWREKDGYKGKAFSWDQVNFFNCKVLPATKSLMLGKLLNLSAVCFFMAVLFSLPESG